MQVVYLLIKIVRILYLLNFVFILSAYAEKYCLHLEICNLKNPTITQFTFHSLLKAFITFQKSFLFQCFVLFIQTKFLVTLLLEFCFPFILILWIRLITKNHFNFLIQCLRSCYLFKMIKIGELVLSFFNASSEFLIWGSLRF